MPQEESKILLVDDEKDYLNDFFTLFSKKFNVITAPGGTEALQILEKETVAVVVSDQRMPQMSGDVLLAEVARKYPQTIRVLMTGYADLDAVIQAVNKGQIYRYVSKESPIKEIELVVQQALEKFQLEESNRKLLLAKKKLLRSLAVQENLTLFGTFGQQIHERMEALSMSLFNYVFNMRRKVNEDSAMAEFHRLQGALARLRELSSFSKKIQLSSVSSQKNGINLILQEAVDKARKALPEGSFYDISLDLDHSIPPMSLHRYSFMRVIKEILENALLFTSPETKRVQIRSRYLKPGDESGLGEGASLRVDVEDNGSGIRSEELLKTFAPFYTTFRTEDPPTEMVIPPPEEFNLSPYYHYGFGLPIAQWIVCLRHNGTLDLTSQPGKGTTAIITMPLSA